MNWAHFSAFVWLRWRLMVNQWRRAGALSAVLLMIVTASVAIAAIPLFFGTFALGVYLIPKAEPSYLMYAWDGILFAFMLFWAIGLLTELQRNDPLSISKFLHLPVSVHGAFLINYLSSLMRLSLVMFGPIMAAFALALVYVQGVQQLTAPLLLAAFLLMITALTYQLQGWLASLMNNPRRRRTVVVGVTMTVVLTSLIPNFFNLYFSPRFAEQNNARSAAHAENQAKLVRAVQLKEIDAAEYKVRQKKLNEDYLAESERTSKELLTQVQRVVQIVNTVVPLGWLPLGVMTSAEGRILPSLLGLAGLTMIGAFSLRRAYGTTLAQFQGQSSNRQIKAPTPTHRAEGDRKPRNRLVEGKIPGFSEPVSVIALGGLRSLIRSPEAKITLLMPLIMGGVFGSMLLQFGSSTPESVRPLVGIAAMAFVLFGMLAIMGNQFGIDRDGFRLFVLCPAARRDILLGKNLSCAPAAFVLSVLLVGAAMILCPMRFDHALSMIPQFVSMFLLFCLMANLCSIYAPMYVTAGTLKPASPKTSTILLQILMFMVLFPLAQGLTLIPLGVEALMHAYHLGEGWPIDLLLSVVECAAIMIFFHYCLGWLGYCLQSREQAILERVTNRAA